MCGIAGHLAYPLSDAARVRRMTDALTHRGPDGEGFYHDGPIAMGHRRLAIIDVEGGAQPIFNEDRTLAIIFNGEIYNYKELRKQLQTNHSFETGSDTEVLIHLYEERGHAMLAELRGMFAFAIWDSRQQRLFAARDPFGEKPFLYAQTSEGFFFGSEMKALLAAGVDLGEVDRGAISDFLELMYIPAPHTIYSQVRKLPAGHLLIADRRGASIEPYYRPPQPGAVDFPPSPASLRAALEEAVRLQLRSDVPIAALLSGGLDSSAVVALMSRELGSRVRTFSVGFGRADDELPFAKLVARRFNTDHQEILVTTGIRDQVADAFSAYSEPFGDSSAVPALTVARAVSNHVKVVLTGDGGDEMFAGYERYRRMRLLPHLPTGALAAAVGRKLRNRAASRVRRLLSAVGSRGRLRQRAMTEIFSLEERTELMGGSARTAWLGPNSGVTDLDTAIAFDLTTSLPDDMLVKTDIACMHVSLESRSPLLDTGIAALAVPPASRLKQGARQGKLLLRDAVGHLLPEQILRRPKRGFGSPVDQWLRGPLRDMFRDLLSSPKARVRNWLDGKEIDRIVHGTLTGQCNAQQGWVLFSLEGWASMLRPGV